MIVAVPIIVTVAVVVTLHVRLERLAVRRRFPIHFVLRHGGFTQT